MNRHEVEAAVDRISEKDGWMTKYNVEHRFVMYRTIDLDIKVAAFKCYVKNLVDHVRAENSSNVDHIEYCP